MRWQPHTIRRVDCCPDAPHVCPGCGRIMSHREWDEQRQCNDCAEGHTG